MKTTRNLWPYGIILTFVLLFCGITTVIIIATTHREAMVSENYYEQELTYQNQIDGTARAQKAGAAIALDATSGNVVVSVPAVQLSQKFSGTLEMYRPSDPKLDQTLNLAPLPDGKQTLDSSKLATGLWVARARWNVGGEDYYVEQKLTIAAR